MVDFSIYWRYRFFLVLFLFPFSSYGTEKEEDIFEKPEEERVDQASTFFITPRKVKQNYGKYHRMNRSVNKIDHFTVAEKHRYNFQDLGNHWTASQHIFYKLPQSIGATYGLSTYDFYFKQPEDIRYYHTSKAYADFNIVLANLGSFVFNGCYTQRLLENWHIGTNWYGAMAEKEWPHNSKDDKIVNAFPNFDLFTHIKNLDGSYHLFTSWSNSKYITRETGGVRSTKKTTNKNKKEHEFAFTEVNPTKRYHSSLPLLEEPYMVNKVDKDKKVIHKDFRRNFYLYHHYEYSQTLQLYQELNYSRKKNSLTIENLDNSLISFISNQPHGNDNSKEGSSVLMQSFANEIGIKGDINYPDLFYALHYKLENIYLNYRFCDLENTICDPRLGAQKKEKEHYLGGKTRLKLTTCSQLHLEAACLLQKGGYHRLNVSYENNFFKIAYHTIKHKTPYIVEHGYSKRRLWNKHFLPPSAQEIETAISYKSTHIVIHPILSFKKINNHIYYRKGQPYKENHSHCVSEPVQASTPVYLFSLESNLNFCFFSYFHFDNSLTILKDLSKKMKIFKGYIPPYMYTGRYYYAHQPYDKKMNIETGLNIHFKELYYGDDYDIIAQQFYRQNKFPVQGRPIVDIFCNFRINNLKLSFKYSYINEYFNKPEAYFASPFYPALKKGADIGIHWSFFD